MKALKAFMKPFQAPRRSVKIKIKLIFILLQLSKMYGAGEELTGKLENSFSTLTSS